MGGDVVAGTGGRKEGRFFPRWGRQDPVSWRTGASRQLAGQTPGWGLHGGAWRRTWTGSGGPGFRAARSGGLGPRPACLSRARWSLGAEALRTRPPLLRVVCRASSHEPEAATRPLLTRDPRETEGDGLARLARGPGDGGGSWRKAWGPLGAVGGRWEAGGAPREQSTPEPHRGEEGPSRRAGGRPRLRGRWQA